MAAKEKGHKADGSEASPIRIKKYANRRLYNTATSSYVTLDHLCQMVQEGVEFVVTDAKTGEDITRSVLTQIIVEEEAKGQNLLPTPFLRKLISFYGDSMQWLVPSYLEQMMEAFAMNQDRLHQSVQETFGGIFPFPNLEEMSKQNMALFENAMRMFSPFPTDQQEKPPSEQPASRDQGNAESLEQLKAQVDLLQKQIHALSKSRNSN